MEEFLRALYPVICHEIRKTFFSNTSLSRKTKRTRCTARTTLQLVRRSLNVFVFSTIFVNSVLQTEKAFIRSLFLDI